MAPPGSRLISASQNISSKAPPFIVASLRLNLSDRPCSYRWIWNQHPTFFVHVWQLVRTLWMGRVPEESWGRQRPPLGHQWHLVGYVYWPWFAQCFWASQMIMGDSQRADEREDYREKFQCTLQLLRTVSSLCRICSSWKQTLEIISRLLRFDKLAYTFDYTTKRPVKYYILPQNWSLTLAGLSDHLLAFWQCERLYPAGCQQ